MTVAVVTHGTASPGATQELGRFIERAERELGIPLEAWTLDDVASRARPGDRVFALFFTKGGHVRRDLLPALDRARARFAGTIPPRLTAGLVVEELRSRGRPPGSSVLLVQPRSRVAPEGKRESMEAIALGVRRAGFVPSIAYYDDPAGVPPARSAGATQPVAFLLVLLPGYTLKTAPPVLREKGYEVLPGPWLGPLAPALLSWIAGASPSSTGEKATSPAGASALSVAGPATEGI